MKKLILPFAALLVFGNITLSFSKTTENTEGYVFVNSAQIRNNPSIESGNVTDTLKIGHKVTVLSKEASVFTQNGVDNYWFKVSYLINGNSKKGFIWGGLLSFDYITPANGNLILIGVTSFKKNAGYALSVKIIRDNSLLSNTPLILTSKSPQVISGLSNLKIDFYDNLGLAYFDNILRVSLNNMPDHEKKNTVIIGIKNNRSIHIAEEKYQGQAGAGHYSGIYIFPNEKGGQSGCVIYNYTEYKFDEKAKKDVMVKNDNKTYVWDTNSAQLIIK